MAEPLLRISELVAGYGTPVVGPLSLEVLPGEVVGLWGANGAGKSTLLHAVARQCTCFSGVVEPRPGLVLAWQPQQPPKLPEMPFTGAEYLHYAGARGTPPPRLAAWLGQRVDQLSGGQFQLLAVWAALGGDADLVLLDEPTNNLDPDGEAVLAELLGQVGRERAVLLVSHQRDFVTRACSRSMEVAA
ncbi:MAG: ATP-binding cassette domain-containing protein [Pseudomonadota bacterium]|nr:ATP-binding cassette domain-containing protein [Pseudomonadota bacterium]